MVLLVPVRWERRKELPQPIVVAVGTIEDLSHKRRSEKRQSQHLTSIGLVCTFRSSKFGDARKCPRFEETLPAVGTDYGFQDRIVDGRFWQRRRCSAARHDHQSATAPFAEGYRDANSDDPPRTFATMLRARWLHAAAEASRCCGQFHRKVCESFDAKPDVESIDLDIEALD